jgi:hypothetical protein
MGGVSFARLLTGPVCFELTRRIRRLLSFSRSTTFGYISCHNGTTLTQFRVASRLLSDAVSSIPDQGFLFSPDQSRSLLLAKVTEFDQLLANNRVQDAITKLNNDIKPSITDSVADDYEANPLELSKTEVQSLIGVLETRLSAAAPMKCDADGDHDKDQTDLQLIRQANGQVAQSGDPRDGNGDGHINVADVRYCQLRLTPIQ